MISNALILPILGFVYKLRPNHSRMILGGIIILQTVCLFIPFFSTDGQNVEISYFDLLVSKWSIQSIGIFSAYIASFLFLWVRNTLFNRLSAISFLTAFVLGITISWPFIDNYGPNSNPHVILFLAFWMFVPIITILFYIPLVTTKKEILKSVNEYKSDRDYIAKIPYEVHKLPLIIAALITIIFAHLAVLFTDKIHCAGQEICRVQGDWFLKASPFLIGAGFLSLAIVVLLWRGIPIRPKDKKIFLILLPFTLVLFIYASYIGFNSRITANNRSIKINTISVFNEKVNKEIKWNNLKAYRIDSYHSEEKYGDDCRYELYLLTRENEEIKLLDYSEDGSFINFLNERDIPKASYKVDECNTLKGATNQINKP